MPALSTAQPLKVATPLTATTGFDVHVSTAPVPPTSAKDTAFVAPVMVVPTPSLTATTICVPHAFSDTPPLGCVVTARARAVPSTQLTAVGVPRGDVVLSPFWPSPPAPQQYNAPADVRAQVPEPSAAMREKVRPPSVAVGTLRFVVVLSPALWSPLYPQHQELPATVRAQACVSPTDTLANACDDATRVGEVRCTVVLPSPSCPDPCRPQQYTSFVFVTAHAYCAPTLTFV